MASVLLVKEKMATPMEWYSRVMECGTEWEFDDVLKSYHLGDIYLKECSDSICFEDFSENEFFAWETSSWISLSLIKELIYGYYDEDNGNAEFVHIKGGQCHRDYRVYNFEVDTNEGISPKFNDWTDVAQYVDENML